MNDVKMIENDELNVMFFVKILWRGKFLIIALTLICSILSFVYIKRLPAMYVSTSKWLPEKAQNTMNNQLGGFAALAGMNLMNSSGNGYEAMYGDLLQSPILLDSLLNRTWNTKVGRVNLLTFLNCDTSLMVVEETYISKEYIVKEQLYTYLKNIISYKSIGSYLSLEVLTTDPVLSYDINKYLIQLIKQYTEDDKSKKSGRNRHFVEGRFNDFRASLRRAEKTLKKFRERNMAISTPALVLEQQRLVREVEIYNQLVIEFRKQLELSRVEEVKGMPDFVILQEPSLTIAPAKPNKKIMFITSVTLSFSISCLVALFLFWLKDNGRRIKEEFQS